MNMPEGSLEECRYYLVLPKDLAYGEAAGFDNNLEEFGPTLNVYAAALLPHAF